MSNTPATVTSVKTEKDSLNRDTERCQKDLAQLGSDRDVITASLDGAILNIFNRVKAKQPDAVAIAEVKAIMPEANPHNYDVKGKYVEPKQPEPPKLPPRWDSRRNKHVRRF